MIYDVVEVVIDQTIRTFKLREWQFDIEELVEDIAEALKLIGAAKVYEEKAALLTFNSMVAPLPRDLQNIKHVEPACPYKESGSFLEAGIADGGTLTLVYQAMPVDARGYILVPDNAAVRAALMWYIVRILILQGEIKHVPYATADAEWDWRCGSARAELNVWNMQQAWERYQEFTRLNPTKDAHYDNYQSLGRGNTLDRNKSLDDYRTN